MYEVAATEAMQVCTHLHYTLRFSKRQNDMRMLFEHWIHELMNEVGSTANPGLLKSCCKLSKILLLKYLLEYRWFSGWTL
jgi:hypothetical protein